MFMLIVKQRWDQMALYVGSAGLFSAMTVLSLKALTIYAGLYFGSSNDANDSAHQHTPLNGTGPALSVLIVSFVITIVATETMKQASLTKFPISQLLPTSYSTFTILTVISNLLVFGQRSASNASSSAAIMSLEFIILFGGGCWLVSQGLTYLKPPTDGDKST
jgi:hypothetical protein